MRSSTFAGRWAERALRVVIAVAFGTGAGVFSALTTHSAAAQPTPASPAPDPLLAPTTPPTWAPTTTTSMSLPPTTSTTAPTVAPAREIAPPTSAPAPAPTSAPAPAMTIQQRGEAALARLTYPYQQLGYTIVFLPGMPGYFGRGFHEQRRIEVYVRSNESDDELAHIVAHEIGHAVDWLYHTPARDREWLLIRGVDPTTEWAPCPFCTDFGAPSGDFAETFALWQLGRTTFASTLAPRPTPAQLQELSKLFYP